MKLVKTETENSFVKRKPVTVTIFTFAVPRMAVIMAQSATFSACTSPRIAGGLTKAL